MDIQEKIDAYVKNILSPEDRTAFERELEQDAGLQEQVRLARLDLHVANRIIEEDIRQKMAKWTQEDNDGDDANPPTGDPPPAGGSGGKAPRYVLLAVALGVAAIGGFYLLGPGNDKPVELPVEKPRQQPDEKPVGPVAQAPNEPETPPPSNPPGASRPAGPVQPAGPDVRALAMAGFRYETGNTLKRDGEEQASPKTPLQQAAKAMDDGDAGMAVSLLADFPPTDPEYVSALYLLAQAYFKQQDFVKAEQTYLEILASKKLSPVSIEWNLLMCYLAQYPRKRAERKALLTKILQTPRHPNYQQAVELSWILKESD